MSRHARRWMAALLALTIAACAPSTADRERGAQALLAQITITPRVDSVALAATLAFADFGVGSDGGVRHVRVRIVESLQVRLQISTARDVRFATPPRLCLVGPDAAPDDAGLSDPCWGEPDLGALLGDRLATDRPDGPVLSAAQPVELVATISRGDDRCDYPPGDWTVRLFAEPIVDGVAVTGMPSVRVPVTVAIPEHGPLVLVPSSDSRYCGLATAVLREQGEPPIIGDP